MDRAPPTPDFSEFLRVAARIGWLSFGGPAGQIALMHRELVEERRWIDEADFLHALNFCHLLPGPEAQQLATYIGWKLHGRRGGLAAGVLFVLPGALIMLLLSALYVVAARADWFSALFLGIKAAVLAIIVQALMRISGRALDTRMKQAIAAAAFLALAALGVPFPWVVLLAGLFGLVIATRRPDWLALPPAQSSSAPRPALAPTLWTILFWALVWALPMALVWAVLGQGHILWKIGLFFSQLAVVTFGGAYAVLAFMAQQAVNGFGWLTAGQMADGLGLAETTPGPLIMVTQFVGFLAAWGAPAPFSPWLAGLLGAALTTWVTFAPCFLWIFAFAPWIDRLRAAPRLQGGLAAITAAVVGVIASLALWFAGHVLLRPAQGDAIVDITRLDLPVLGIALAAGLVLFGLKWSVLRTLAMASFLGLGVGMLNGG